MEIIFNLVNQLIIMGLLMLVGFVSTKKKWIDLGGTRQLGALLLNVVVPVLIINSFIRDFKLEDFKLLGIASFFALVWHILFILLSNLFFKKNERIERTSLVFSNLGFFGIPIIASVLGSDAVFYLIGPMIVFWMFFFTYGENVLTGNNKLEVKKLLLNPGVISALIGIILYISNFALPSIVVSTMGYISALNTPLAMIVMGCYLAHTDLNYFKNVGVWKVSLLRLVVLPLLVIILFKFVDSSIWTLKYITLICVSAPVASSLPILAQQHDLDYKFSAAIVCLSSLLVMITLPIMSYVGLLIW